VLLLTLAVFAMTARFLGLRNGAIAGGVSFGLIVVAGILPLIPIGLLIYAAHLVWVGALWHLGKKVERMRSTGPWQSAQKWARRGRSLFRW
jgi:hypothetical protein